VSLSELQAIERDHVVPSYARFPVEFVRGAGWTLFDDEGNEYLDFLAGISVLNVGHCHPGVVEAVSSQVATLQHVTNLFYSEPGMRLAKRLSEGSLGGKVYFANSGAEANEAAIKLARKARPRGEIVVVEGAFHGRTYGALSATPQPAKQAPFEPLVPGFVTVAKDPAALDAAVGEQTAAVLIEPIQGETGINILDDELLRAARAACDRTGALLVFDEIQCGMGRTGDLWAWQGVGVEPDLMTSAKGLGGGMPIGALITSPAYADVFEPGDHGSTFAGGPVIAAAANAALDVVDTPELLASVRALGERLLAGLAGLPHVTATRGRGLMVAIDVDADAPAAARRALLDQRLIVNATGPSTIRLLPPLIVGEAQIDEALARLGSALAAG
jgi:acetylornithine/N-succinyldiaminopimelate aminotransferase